MKFSVTVLLPFVVAAAVAEPVPKRELVVKEASVLEDVEVRAESTAAASDYTNVKVTTSALKCRTCPKTSCTATRQYSKGTIVKVYCDKATGTTSVNGNPWWGKTSDGCWIAEYYVDYYQGAPSSCV